MTLPFEHLVYMGGGSEGEAQPGVHSGSGGRLPRRPSYSGLLPIGFRPFYNGLEVEQAFRTVKKTLKLRSVDHFKDDLIRSHLLICSLALPLVRIAGKKTGLSWPRIRKEMQRKHLGEFSNKKDRALRCTELTNDQNNLLKTL